MTYRTLARRTWPRAGWIAGAGPYATVSDCAPCVTIELHATRAEAERALAVLDELHCGHTCTGRHRLVDLAAETAAVS